MRFRNAARRIRFEQKFLSLVLSAASFCSMSSSQKEVQHLPVPTMVRNTVGTRCPSITVRYPMLRYPSTGSMHRTGGMQLIPPRLGNFRSNRTHKKNLRYLERIPHEYSGPRTRCICRYDALKTYGSNQQCSLRLKPPVTPGYRILLSTEEYIYRIIIQSLFAQCL